MTILITTPKDFGFLPCGAPSLGDLRPLCWHMTDECDLIVYRETVDKNHILKDRNGVHVDGFMDDVSLLVLLADEFAREAQ